MLKKVERNNVKIIPSDTLIQCPKVRFILNYGRECLKCRYFDGLGIIDENDMKPWHQRYTIRCVHPIERRTQTMQQLGG